MGCQNGPKNLQGPPKPPCFYFLAANNDDRRTAGLFCRSARPRTPFFFGGTIDEKKRMRCHGMGCQNGPKNLQGPQFPNPLFCFGSKEWRPKQERFVLLQQATCASLSTPPRRHTVLARLVYRDLAKVLGRRTPKIYCDHRGPRSLVWPNTILQPRTPRPVELCHLQQCYLAAT